MAQYGPSHMTPLAQISIKFPISSYQLLLSLSNANAFHYHLVAVSYPLHKLLWSAL